MVDVLANTKPEGTSKAKYSLADGTAERVSAAAAELLDANPLYPASRSRFPPYEGLRPAGRAG